MLSISVRLCNDQHFPKSCNSHICGDCRPMLVLIQQEIIVKPCKLNNLIIFCSKYCNLIGQSNYTKTRGFTRDKDHFLELTNRLEAKLSSAHFHHHFVHPLQQTTSIYLSLQKVIKNGHPNQVNCSCYLDPGARLNTSIILRLLTQLNTMD